MGTGVNGTGGNEGNEGNGVNDNKLSLNPQTTAEQPLQELSQEIDPEEDLKEKNCCSKRNIKII